MFPASRATKVVKHCANHHVMQMAWRSCPRCTGKPPVLSSAARDMVDATVVVGAPPPKPNAPPPPEYLARLTAISGPLTGKVIEVMPGRTKLGKAPREEAGARLVALADQFLSRDHAALEAGAAAVVLRDLGSTNGTLVNGERVERALLAEGDEVRIGETVYRVALFLRSGPSA